MAAVQDATTGATESPNEKDIKQSTLSVQGVHSASQTTVNDGPPNRVSSQSATSETSATKDPLNHSRTTEPSDDEVRYRVEYRGFRDGLLLMTRESLQDQQQLYVHKGPVFDVVDVNFTAETKDTRKDEQIAGAAHVSESKDARKDEQQSTEAGEGASLSLPPSVQRRGNSFIRIYSRSIINALQSTVNYYPGQDLVSRPVEIQWPYAILWHHWKELKHFQAQFAQSEQSGGATECSVKETYRHLDLLFDFLDKKLGQDVREEYARWAQPVPKASFPMLWLLLKPGIDIYERDEESGDMEPFVLSSVVFTPFDNSWDDYRLYTWYLENDATSIRPSSTHGSIDSYQGEKPIHELIRFPCEYLPDHAARKAELIKRGKLYASLQQKKLVYFDGKNTQTPPRPFKGYVMVDPVHALEDNPGDPNFTEVIVEQKPAQLPLCSCIRCSAIESERTRPPKFKGYKKIEFKSIPEMTEHQYIMCSWAVYGFVLSTRNWEHLYLDGFKEPQWNTSLLDSLVLHPATKKMLFSLCQLYLQQNTDSATSKSIAKNDSHPKAKVWSADYVDEKGKGLVLLLHGKPGVGKTYTAECMAHVLKRPLLSITCADIGVDPSQVEPNLRTWFNRARRWDAVLLIDEADVYFESRQTQDLNRNNLVASFLRAIEYYDGILFLTTNRVGTSDEAVWSRIHATLYYDSFSDEQRQKIWNTYFDKLEEERGEEIRVMESAKEYVQTNKEVQALEWNGRQIRNAFQIAVNLAQADESRDSKGRFQVKRDHIKVTVDLLKDFGSYMLKTQTMSPSKNAEVAKLRFDAFNATSNPDESPF